MTQTTTEIPSEMDFVAVDGNAAGGLLRQLFTFDVTVARIVCSGCTSSHPLAALRLYGQPMGSILRCPDCHAVLIRVVAHEPEYWLDMRGVESLRVSLP
jgi:Family of unknown function (DUF6510)